MMIQCAWDVIVGAFANGTCDTLRLGMTRLSSLHFRFAFYLHIHTGFDFWSQSYATVLGSGFQEIGLVGAVSAEVLLV
jgi:hypothetical protein